MQRLHELEPIAERISCVDAVITIEGFVVDDLHSCVAQKHHEARNVTDE